MWRRLWLIAFIQVLGIVVANELEFRWAVMGLIYKTIVCYPNITASRFVAISIIIFCILLQICFTLQEKECPTITPPKQMQNLWFYWLQMPLP